MWAIKRDSDRRRNYRGNLRSDAGRDTLRAGDGNARREIFFVRLPRGLDKLCGPAQGRLDISDPGGFLQARQNALDQNQRLAEIGFRRA
jgi:hypothetical protein